MAAAEENPPGMSGPPMEQRRPPAGRLAAVAVAACVGAWLAAVAVPPVVFLRWRATRLEEVSAPAAQAEWDRFRAAMQADAEGPGPVRRKVPRSPEPPERVWLRDYPHVVVAAWVVFVGLLGAVVGWLLRGALLVPDGTPRLSGPGRAALRPPPRETTRA